MIGVFLLLFVLPTAMAALLTAWFAGWTGAVVAVIVGAAVLVAGVLLARFLFRGYRATTELVAATARLADGDYATRVSVDAPPAFAPIIASFNDMARRLETADALRRSLLADVGHELRTPLTIIRGELEAMADGVREVNEAAIRRLLVDVAGMERLLEDLRTLSATEAGVLGLYREQVDVVGLVVSVVDRFRLEAEARDIGLRVLVHDRQVAPSVDGGDGWPEPVEAEVDAHRIAEVISNLVTNAMRAVGSHGLIQIGVTSEPGDDGRAVVIRVEDDGVGIPADQVDVVFDRFHKSAHSTGSGLGLTISRDLVEAHGGSIEVAGGGPVGTIMTVRLPPTAG
jgi:signal transduction histidine kinase